MVVNFVDLLAILIEALVNMGVFWGKAGDFIGLFDFELI